MLLTHQHPDNKSIMISVLGATNVGKSSLINCLLGTDLSVVTHKAQTTRNKFHCVFTIDKTEIIMVDTPGLHKSNKELNKRLNEQAREGIEGADINLLLIDLTQKIMPQFNNFVETLKRDLNRTWIIFTKSDVITEMESLPLKEVVEEAKKILPSIENYFVVSSKKEENIHLLTGAICDAATTGYHLYPDGELSNKSERFFVAEYIREQTFLLLSEELPYEIAVVMEDYLDMRKNKFEETRDLVNISANILVNRPSQRAIVVGKKGSIIKEIGTKSRQRIEKLVDCQVNLNLHVKVSPRWFKNNFVLEEIGLPRATDSARVWRRS